MLLQPRNLYNPVEYMIRRLMKKQSIGSGMVPQPPVQGNCLDVITPVDLIRENGRLKKVLASSFFIELFYGDNNLLNRVVGQCDNGYKLEIELIFEKGVLVRVEPTETMGGDENVDAVVIPGDTEAENEAWAAFNAGGHGVVNNNV